jgi:aquaporin Z
VYAMFDSAMSASVTLPSENNVMRAFILETVMTFTLVYTPPSPYISLNAWVINELKNYLKW